ncbi:hypothetical protein M5K25_012448 [Dendrobium thyrsiflorum]|uniref:Secreted protein n=1 Tax=Dendrobium thyrsiflorum TaxID=117978 RepID=A0ABD0V472_DENTH
MAKIPSKLEGLMPWLNRLLSLSLSLVFPPLATPSSRISSFSSRCRTMVRALGTFYKKATIGEETATIVASLRPTVKIVRASQLDAREHKWTNHEVPSLSHIAASVVHFLPLVCSCLFHRRMFSTSRSSLRRETCSNPPIEGRSPLPHALLTRFLPYEDGRSISSSQKMVNHRLVWLRTVKWLLENTRKSEKSREYAAR